MNSESVLVLRALGLGDTVAGIAALRGVRRAWPAGSVVLAGPGRVAGWLRGLGIVDEVLHTTGLARLDWPFRRGPDVAVNLHGSGPQSHRLLQATRPGRLVAFRCDAAGHHDGPAWAWAEHEVSRWCRLVAGAGGTCDREDLRLPRLGLPHDDVVVHPGAGSDARRWPASRWREVVRALRSRGFGVVVTGSREERRLCAEVAGGLPGVTDLSGALSVPGLADLISGAPLVLCGDTGPAHLATAYGTPSVLLFGPTSPERWGPAIDPGLHVVLWHGQRGHDGDPHADAIDPALARIGVGEVLEAATVVLARRGSGALPHRVGEP